MIIANRTKLMKLLAVAFAFVWMTGCATTAVPPPVEKIVVQEVKVPVHSPCPAKGDKPVRPKRVAEEHGVMPVDLGQQVRILASKVLEWTTYGERADGVMSACAK